MLKNGVYQMQAENIVLLKKRATCLRRTIQASGRFFYFASGSNTADRFWLTEAIRSIAAVEHFYRKAERIVGGSHAGIGNETDPEKKLRKLYERAQQIRNLTFERERTEQEQKKENIKPNQNAAGCTEPGLWFAE